MADVELAGIEFGEQIMYIKNYCNSLPLGKYCREDEKVRNVVYVNSIVPVLSVFGFKKQC
jgi:hypothetical protein